MTTSGLAPDNDEDHQPSNNYPPFLPQNETEVARLLVRHRRLSDLLDGILPKSLDLSNVHQVLDVACGVGSWSLDMSRKHPTMQITAIDQSHYFIEQARAQAKSQQLPNITFIMHNMQHLEANGFTPASFDLINISLTTGKITLQEFPSLLQSLVHLCRPEGILHWLEAEFPITNSPAYQHLTGIILQALKSADHTFSPSNNSLGITACMAAWLQNAGCRIIQDNAHAIEISVGTPAHPTFLRQTWLFAHQIQPFLLATGVTTLPEFEALFQRTQKEISAQTFCGICLLREVVATKLHEGEQPEVYR